MKRGIWTMNSGGILSSDKGGFADIFEGFNVRTASVDQVVKDLFGCCFKRSKYTPQDVRDLHALVTEFIRREREVEAFRKLEHRVRKRLYPEWNPPLFDVYWAPHLPCSTYEVAFFGGLEGAKAAREKIRQAALEEWEQDHGESFPRIEGDWR